MKKYSCAAAIFALGLGGCATTPQVVPVNLPPRPQIIADPETRPVIRQGDNLGTSLLKSDAALGRANTKLSNAASNYERLRQTLAGTTPQ